MPDVADILEVKLFQQYGSAPDQILNVFHYRVASQDEPWSLTTDGQSFIEEWSAWWSTEWAQLMSAIVSWDTIQVNNLDDDNEFFIGDLAVPPVGGVSGEALPSFNAWSIQLVRSTRNTRHGWKRFCGVAESLLGNGVPQGTAPTTGQALADRLSNNFALTDVGASGNAVNLTPVIVRKTGNLEYSAVNPVQDGIFRGLTSQVTRKFGRGS